MSWTMVVRLDAKPELPKRDEIIKPVFKIKIGGFSRIANLVTALQPDLSERPSTCDEMERALKILEEGVMMAPSVEGLEYTSKYKIRSTKHGAGPNNDVSVHWKVDPEIGNVINCQCANGNPDKMIKKHKGGLMGPVCQQAVAGVIANQITATGSDTALGVHFMKIAIVLGMSFKLAGVALKGNKRPNLPIWMGKIGDVLAASAIILSLAMHLPPVMAWTAAPLAFLVIAFAVAFA